MNTLARRVALLTVGVAVVSTVLTAGLLLNVVRQASDEAGRALLGRDAEVLAVIARGSAGRASPGLGVDAVQQAYARRGISTAVVEPGGAAPPEPFRSRDVAEAAGGVEVSRVRSSAGQEWFVEARSAGDRVVLLAQPAAAARDVVPPPRRRIALAALMAAGIAVLGGVLLARALARPLVRLDSAARRMSAGERDVRVPPEGPQEIADLAHALNGLSDALAASEGRQRRFLLTVSHELRTPLTAVAGYGEALADGVVTGEAARDAGRVIVEESARLRVRVEELLALARLSADDVTVESHPVDVVEVLGAARDAWLVRARSAGVPLVLEVAGPVVAVADGERVRQAVDALVDNALRVLESLAPRRSAGDEVRPPVVLAAGAAGPTVTVEVRDGGPGLDEGDLAVAFEPGRLSERYRGTRPVGSGVGLALVARLAELMGGSVVAGRAPEGGLSVVMELPRA